MKQIKKLLKKLDKEIKIVGKEYVDVCNHDLSDLDDKIDVLKELGSLNTIKDYIVDYLDEIK